MNNLIKKLQELRLSKCVNSDIAQYFLSLDSKKVLKIKMKDVESICHVSAPSVSRFCNQCGIESFSIFKYELSKQLSEIESSVSIESTKTFQHSNTYKDIVNDAIESTSKIISEELIKKSTSLINEAKQIIIFAGGSTFFVAEDLQRKLIKVEKNVHAYNDDYWMRFSTINADKDTLFIGITYSGQTKNVMNNLHIASYKGYKTMLITSYNNVELAKEHTLGLFVDSTEVRDRLVNTSSRIAIYYLIDVIYYAYISNYYPLYFNKYSELRA